jgi:hypothetical protein
MTPRDRKQLLQFIVDFGPSEHRNHGAGAFERGRWHSAGATLDSYPTAAGVYVLYRGAEAVYVGQSCNIRHRLRRHFNSRESGAQPSWETCKFKLSKRMGDWAMWEIRLIHRLKPVGNTILVGMKAA